MTIASLNLWYVAAIIFGALAAFCGYYGSLIENRKNSDEQSSRIESQLQDLADDIQRARRDHPSDEGKDRVSDLQNRYDQIAEEFFRNLPLRTAEHQSQQASEIVTELRRTAELREVFENVLTESRALAIAFNNQAGREILEIESSSVPDNVFRLPPGYLTYVLFRFDSGETWAFRLIFQDATPAFQLVRIEPSTAGRNYSEMGLTNDSINLVVLPETFSTSLNTHISVQVRTEIVSDEDREERPKMELSDRAVTLVRRMIEFSIVLNNARNEDAT